MNKMNQWSYKRGKLSWAWWVLFVILIGLQYWVLNAPQRAYQSARESGTMYLVPASIAYAEEDRVMLHVDMNAAKWLASPQEYKDRHGYLEISRQPQGEVIVKGVVPKAPPQGDYLKVWVGDLNRGVARFSFPQGDSLVWRFPQENAKDLPWEEWKKEEHLSRETVMQDVKGLPEAERKKRERQQQRLALQLNDSEEVTLPLHDVWVELAVKEDQVVVTDIIVDGRRVSQYYNVAQGTPTTATPPAYTTEHQEQKG